MVWYLDTSAFLKLLVNEAETPAMRAWHAAGRACWASQLLRTEAMRAAAHLDIPERVLIDALESVSLVLPGPSTFLAAGRMQPPGVRSVGALHVAAALELGDELEAIVTYDDLTLAAARAVPGAVLSPT